jgi:hydrogenase maturation protease
MKKSKTESCRILLIAIGNCGRGDDGLGWKFADTIQELGLDFIDFEYRYQLQVEDASLICNYDTIIFADASHKKLMDGFEIKRCNPAEHFFYSSHMQSPETILFLAHKLFGKSPKAYTLAISGVEWDLKTFLNAEAERNMIAAITFFKNEFLSEFNPVMTTLL